MAVSLDSTSPVNLENECFWSSLRSRTDTLLENRNPKLTSFGTGELERNTHLKEDCLLLLKGFDSISSSLSQLSDHLDTAAQGARDMGKASLIEELHNNLDKDEQKEGQEKDVKGAKRKIDSTESSDDHGNFEVSKDSEQCQTNGAKRKIDSTESSDDHGNFKVSKDSEQCQTNGKLKKAKNLALSMATKATYLARELKFLKSDLCFMKYRCAMLEEENRKLREGCGEGSRPEEDDLVRLQLEALLAEKSRLGNENANLTRENQCLHQLVEYHQLTSEDLSASYEHIIHGMCLDFSSPPSQTREEDNKGDGTSEAPQTPRRDIFGFSSSFDGCYNGDEHQ
ncbi:hypothetical protein GIB67_005807 [Kingdonia uniflora]|uniref:Uncharacterized protein n=1 Tax=Kingdonia uniflora TaxID=39325 RepID=A0A7J7MB96_9MAGN|nr:hypothetical protein GIB67_005807 [Kingdonia uniflora]